GKRAPRVVSLGLAFVIIIGAMWWAYRHTQLTHPTPEFLNTADQLSFYSHWETRLPKYRDIFVDASIKHGLEWPLLSAIGYQESRWQPEAVSPTGVRGLMMLTQSTAKELGVVDRTEPEDSIQGGARYLKYLLSRAPQELDDDGKLWFAVSAYNGGINRLLTAYRQWTSIEGIAPDWYSFEKDMLGAADKSALKVSMLYTRRVRDFYKIAAAFAARGD
ncbi:MAG: transglycosylase SLT domain-containing protein, partial [Gammaproteobacteria bacterium]